MTHNSMNLQTHTANDLLKTAAL